MASLDQISQALLNADAAGDTEAATALAQEYRKLSQTSAVAPTVAPVAAPERPFFDLSDTLSATGRAFTSLGTSVPASMRQAFGGLENPWQRSESYMQSRADMQALQEELNASEAAALAGGDASSVSSSIREATPSLGFSGSTLVPSLAAGAVTALATKSPVAARSAAAGTSLLMAYRMAGAQFLDDSRERIDNFFQEKLQRPLTPEEQNEAYEELLPLARKFGAAEAGPEALGNMALGGAGKYIRKALGGKNGIMSLASNALSKVTGAKAVGAGIGAAAGEVGTEAITAVEQDRINKEFEQSVLRGEAPESVVLPDRTVQDYTKGITEVAPTTLAMTGLMGLAGLGPTAINRGYRALRPQAEQQAVEAEIVPEEPAPAPPPAPKTPSQIIPKELVVKANETSPDVSSSTTAFVELNENLLKTQAEGVADKAAQMLAQEQAAQAQAAAELQAQLEATTPEQPLAQAPQAPVELPVPTVAPTVETPSPAMEQIETPSQTITGSNVQTGTEMPVPPPTAEAGAGVGEAPVTEETVLPAQPTTPLENAPLKIPEQESLLQEPQGRVEGRETAEASLGDQLLSPAPSQEEVAPPITPQGTPTPATEGTVMPGGSAMKRDVTKPEQMTPGEAASNFTPIEKELIRLTKLKKAKPVGDGIYEIDAINRSKLLPDNAPFGSIPRGTDRISISEKSKVTGRSSDKGWIISDRTKNQHVRVIDMALRQRGKVSAAAVDTYGIKLPQGYTRQGDLYVFSPQTKTVATPTETALSQGELTLEETPKQSAGRIKKAMIRFASGMSAIGDLRKGTYARGGHKNYGVGFDVGLLSKNAISELAQIILNLKTQVFIDSGAFSNFKKAIKAPITGKKVEPLDFDQILAKYDSIISAINQANESEETDYPRPMLVMPDVIGNQAESLALIEKYKNWIALEVSNDTSIPIIPIPLGELPLSQAYERILEILESNTLGIKIDPRRFVVGVPSNAEAISRDDLAKFLSESKPPHIHFLGAAADQNINPLIDVVAENSPTTQVTADASKIRSAILSGVAKGKTRSQAIFDALYQEDDPMVTLDAIKNQSPQTEASEAETAAPLAKEAAVASVVQQPAEGSIPAVEQESATTDIE